MDKTMSISQLKEVVKTYGTVADYMDNSEGIIYHINAYFHGSPNVTGMFITYSNGDQGFIERKHLGELESFFEKNETHETTKTEYEKFWEQVEHPVFTGSGFFHTSTNTDKGSVEIELTKDSKEVSFWLHFNNRNDYDSFYDSHVGNSTIVEYEEVGREEAYNYVNSGKGKTYDMFFELIPKGWAADLAGTFLK